MPAALADYGPWTGTAVTGPSTIADRPVRPLQRTRPGDDRGMVRVSLQHHPVTASAAVVWSGDLPRPLQQMLFEIADSLTAPATPRAAELISLTTA